MKAEIMKAIQEVSIRPVLALSVGLASLGVDCILLENGTALLMESRECVLME